MLSAVVEKSLHFREHFLVSVILLSEQGKVTMAMLEFGRICILSSPWLLSLFQVLAPWPLMTLSFQKICEDHHSN